MKVVPIIIAAFAKQATADGKDVFTTRLALSAMPLCRPAPKGRNSSLPEEDIKSAVDSIPIRLLDQVK